MPLSIRRIRELISRNRADIREVDKYFRAKTAALFRWEYYYLEREHRVRDSRLLRQLPTTAEKVVWLRERVENLPERSKFYARSITTEIDARAEIERTDLYLPAIENPVELLKQSITLKTHELDFCRDLLRSLLSFLPTQTRWISEVERVLGLVLKRLEELKAMVGSLDGHVYNADTKEPIEGALVEIADFGVLTDAEGHYRIDWISAEKHRAKCSHELYEPQEADVEIIGAKVVTKDWFLKKPVVAKIWKYTLRVSARVIRGWAPGTSPKVRPKTVRRQVTLTGEPADLLELKHGRKVKERSPIFCELSFESFISSLFERELEDTYKQPLIDIVKGYSSDIATSANFESVELEEWDFLRESKEEIEFKEDKSRDYYEINMYLPSSYSKLIADGHYEHDVGEKERKKEAKKEGEGAG